MKTALLIGSAALLLACTSSVTEVGPDSNPGTTASTTTSGPGAAGGSGGNSTTVTTTTGSGIGGATGMSAIITGTDPVTLTLTSYPLTCANADAQPPFGQCDWYSVQITFAASFLVPGGQPTSDANTSGTVESSGDPNSPTPGDCPGSAAVSGGGAFMPNQITIVSVDAQSVVVNTDGLADLLGGASSVDASVDGQHVATRCPSE